jgi:hypothetical protein
MVASYGYITGGHMPGGIFCSLLNQSILQNQESLLIHTKRWKNGAPSTGGRREIRISPQPAFCSNSFDLDFGSSIRS